MVANLKITFFFPSIKKILFYFILCNFLVRTLQCKKKLKNKIFAHENMKKPPQKVAYLGTIQVLRYQRGG